MYKQMQHTYLNYIEKNQKNKEHSITLFGYRDTRTSARRRSSTRIATFTRIPRPTVVPVITQIKTKQRTKHFALQSEPNKKDFEEREEEIGESQGSKQIRGNKFKGNYTYEHNFDHTRTAADIFIC
jgi:hypothetical protein